MLIRAFVIVACVMIVSLNMVFAGATTLEPDISPRVTEEKIYTGESFREVLEDISSLSGYKVLVPEDLLTIPVYGTFRSGEVDRFLSRILIDFNHLSVFDDSENVIIIRVFGEKTENSVIVSAVPGDQWTDPLTGLTRQAIKQIQIENKLRMAQPGYVDAFTGLTRADMENIQKEQSRKRNNPNFVDAFTGLTRQEMDDIQLQSKHERQRPDAVDPLTGLRRSEIEVVQAKANERRQDPNYVDPFTGLTRSQMNALQKKQLE
jgi:hypothetical protein